MKTSERQPLVPRLSLLPAVTAALAAAGLISSAQAQVQVAGDLLVNVDATTLPVGPVTSVTNNGTLGGAFEAIGGGANNPSVQVVSGNGTPGLKFDGNDFMQHVVAPGGALIPADPTLTGPNPTCSIEAWVLNPDISDEETIVSWGKRGGPDGSNMAFGYGWDDRWGAVGHWGAPDIGWDPCCDSGTDPQGVPKSGVWHLLAYTYDGTTTRVYADGVLKKFETLGLNTATGTPITIGSQIEPDGVNLTGGTRASMWIGRLRIHSEALTDAQIANNYNTEKNSFSNGGSPVPFAPIHRYSFSNPAGTAPNGAVVSDSVGSANGIIRGTGASFTGTRLSLPGGSSATQPYVDLPNRLLSTNSSDNGGTGQITIEGWAKNNAPRSWARIFDFGNGTAGEINAPGSSAEGRDYIFLAANNGTNPNRHELGFRNLIPPAGSDTGAGFDTANHLRDFHFALTWDEPSGQIMVYENGALATTLTVNPANDRFSTIDDVNVWLGRSNWSGDENFQGEYDEFRIYNHVMLPEQVRASYTAGPDQLATAIPVSFVRDISDLTLPENGNGTFNVLVEGAPPIGLQWYKNDVAVDGQTGNTLSLNSVPITDNGATFYAIASNNIGGTAYYATSHVATLTVVADTEPPTLVQARVTGKSTIEVIFSEAINQDDAANVANFSLSPATAPVILSSAPSGPNRVILTLDPSTPLLCDAYTVVVNNVHDVSAAANAIAADSSITFFNFAPPNLIHRYTFNNPAGDASNATVEDVVGTGDGIVRTAGRPTTFTGNRVTLSGGGSINSPYIDLPNGLLSNNSTNKGGSGQVSFEGWVKVTGNHSWSRLFDFGSSGTCCGPGSEIPGPGGSGEGIDYMFYSAEVGTDTGTRRIDLTNRDGGDHGTVGSQFGVGNFNRDMHYVVTWDERTGEIKTYEDGNVVATMTTVAAMSEINDVNVWLGRSNWTADENLEGEYDEFRVYNSVLSPADVQRDRSAGPDSNYGAPLSLELVVPSSMVTGAVQRAQALVNFSNVSTQNVASSGCASFETRDNFVVAVGPDGTLQAVGTGTAVITVRFAGFEDVKEIEVTEDNIPPTVVRVRAATANSVEVIFSEPVEFFSATDPSSYAVSSPSGSLPVATVTQLSDPARVVLQLFSPMPCEYVTVAVNGVTDSSAAFNVIDPAHNSGSFMNYVPAGLLHRYTFNNGSTANGTNNTPILDAVGSGDGALLGSGASFTGDRVVLNGGPSTVAAYIDLPNFMISTNGVANGGSGEVSLEGWVKVTGSHTWSRIFDFGSSLGNEVFGPGGGGEGKDYWMLSAVVGGDPNTRRTEVRNEDPGGGGIFTVDHAATGLNVDTHFVATWKESTGQIKVYENGVQVSSMTVPTQLSEIHDVNVWLGRSNWTGDENLQGEYDEFRVYNRVLEMPEIQLNGTAGPDNALGEPQAVRIAAAPAIGVGETITPTVGADFSSISNVDLTIAKCFTLDTSDATVLTADASGIHGVGPGTANAIVRFNGLSSAVSITVIDGLPAQNHVAIVATGTGYRITFHGTPGTNYHILRTTDLTAPINWTVLDPGATPASGVIVYDDNSAPAGQAFYQVVSP